GLRPRVAFRGGNVDIMKDLGFLDRMVEPDGTVFAGSQKLLVSVLGKKVRIVSHFDAHFLGKLIRSDACEQNMFGPLHHKSSKLDRILDVPNETDSSGF